IAPLDTVTRPLLFFEAEIYDAIKHDPASECGRRDTAPRVAGNVAGAGDRARQAAARHPWRLLLAGPRRANAAPLARRLRHLLLGDLSRNQLARRTWRKARPSLFDRQ